MNVRITTLTVPSCAPAKIAGTGRYRVSAMAEIDDWHHLPLDHLLDFTLNSAYARLLEQCRLDGHPPDMVVPPLEVGISLIWHETLVVRAWRLIGREDWRIEVNNLASLDAGD